MYLRAYPISQPAERERVAEELVTKLIGPVFDTVFAGRTKEEVWDILTGGRGVSQVPESRDKEPGSLRTDVANSDNLPVPPGSVNGYEGHQ